jgi:DNA-binding NtrC family response regulator
MLPTSRAAADRRILIVDDDLASARQLSQFLARPDRIIKMANRGTEALEWLVEGHFALAIARWRLADGMALDLAREIQTKRLPVTMIVTVAPELKIDVTAAEELGVYDLFLEPFDAADCERVVAEVLDDRELDSRTARAAPRVSGMNSADRLVGESAAINALRQAIERLIADPVHVLLTGEPGVGKRHFARMLHQLDSDRLGPCAVIPCEGIPAEMLEADLFGRIGPTAVGARSGRLDQCRDGTIVLESIDALPIETQRKLLRFLKTGSLERPGSVEAIESNVRIVAIARGRLEIAVRNGRFLPPLLELLSAARIEIPPLRDRPEDIRPLIEHGIDRAAAAGVPRRAFSHAATDCLLRHSWPENTRELLNLVERLAICTRDDEVQVSDLPIPLRELDSTWSSELGLPLMAEIDLRRPLRELLESLVERTERLYLRRQLERCRGRIGATAGASGLSRRSMSDKVKRYGIDKARFKRSASRPDTAT